MCLLSARLSSGAAGPAVSCGPSAVCFLFAASQRADGSALAGFPQRRLPPSQPAPRCLQREGHRRVVLHLRGTGGGPRFLPAPPVVRRNPLVYGRILPLMLILTCRPAHASSRIPASPAWANFASAVPQMHIAQHAARRCCCGLFWALLRHSLCFWR